MLLHLRCLRCCCCCYCCYCCYFLFLSLTLPYSCTNIVTVFFVYKSALYFLYIKVHVMMENKLIYRSHCRNTMRLKLIVSMRKINNDPIRNYSHNKAPATEARWYIYSLVEHNHNHNLI